MQPPPRRVEKLLGHSLGIAANGTELGWESQRVVPGLRPAVRMGISAAHTIPP